MFPTFGGLGEAGKAFKYGSKSEDLPKSIVNSFRGVELKTTRKNHYLFWLISLRVDGVITILRRIFTVSLYVSFYCSISSLSQFIRDR